MLCFASGSTHCILYRVLKTTPFVSGSASTSLVRCFPPLFKRLQVCFPNPRKLTKATSCHMTFVGPLFFSTGECMSTEEHNGTMDLILHPSSILVTANGGTNAHCINILHEQFCGTLTVN